MYGCTWSCTHIDFFPKKFTLGISPYIYIISPIITSIKNKTKRYIHCSTELKKKNLQVIKVKIKVLKAMRGSKWKKKLTVNLSKIKLYNNNKGISPKSHWKVWSMLMNESILQNTDFFIDLFSNFNLKKSSPRSVDHLCTG